MSQPKYTKRRLKKFRCLYCGEVGLARQGKLYCGAKCKDKDYNKIIG